MTGNLGSTLIDTLVSIVFSGIPSNATYELLKNGWQRWKKRSWEELFANALKKAVDQERVSLEHYSPEAGIVEVDGRALSRVLHQNLRTAQDMSPYKLLVAENFLRELANQLASNSVLMISGHNLSLDAYVEVTTKLVRHARELFRESVRSDEEGFKRILQETAEEILGNAEEARLQCRDLEAYLEDNFSLLLRRLDVQAGMLDGIKDDLQLLVDAKRKHAGPLPKQVFRVFVASPSDVSDERKIVIQVGEQLRLEPLLSELVTLEVIAWDRPGLNVPLTANLTPQDNVLASLPKPSECDIVVLILWSRMGTPLPKQITKEDGSSYLSGTEWEYLDALKAARRSGNRPQILVYRRTEEPLISMRDPESSEKFRQLALVDDFFGKFRDPDGSILRGYNSYKTTDEFRAMLDTHIRMVISKLLKESSPVEEAPKAERASPVRPRPVWQGSPFPGLRPFTDKDAPIFFGRGRETDELVRLLNRSRFTVVVGASGSGKSSLVWAGVVPRITDEKLVIRFTPGEIGDNPFVILAVRLAPLLEQQGWDVRNLAAFLEQRPDALDDLCRSLTPASKPILFFVDQFEELFRLVRQELRPPFIALLASIVKANDVQVIATLRSDFYSYCLESPKLAELMEKGHFPLSTPRIGALYDMITKPAEIAGIEMEPGLVERILDDMGNEPGTLALLAYTLDELYRANSDGRSLAFADYDALGGVKGAIGRRAENTFMKLDKLAQDALPLVFRELIEVDEQGTATRRRALLAQVAMSEDARRLVDAFINARLLVSQGNDHGTIVEVAHEAIFRNWTRLKQWIDKTQADLFLLRQMRAAATQWEQHSRHRGFLWSGEILQEVQGMLGRLQPELSATEQAFSRPEREHLLEEINDPETNPGRRSAIGERLALLGDIRPGVGVHPNGIPDIVWCPVPSGSIKLEGREFQVLAFYVAKYPITFIQFESFLKGDDGFNKDEWWQELPEEYRKQPMDAQNNRQDNHPRERVSWYQAVAFCRWLTSRYKRVDTNLLHSSNIQHFGELFEKGWSIRLPTEWEFEQAATDGRANYVYPWGPTWERNRANTSEAVIGRTTAVGMFPLGGSTVGAMDMSGNVWEWNLNQYRTLATNEWATEAARALRGGSFSRDRNDARVTARNFDDPFFRYPSFGFRVCFGPPIQVTNNV